MMPDPISDRSEPHAAIIVPAYNEEHRIAPLLPALSDAVERLGYLVVVVCNGCEDRTVELVRNYPSLQLLQFDWASKARALNEAERFIGDVFPRLYVDADVCTTSDSLRHLVEALRVDSPRAVRPSESYIPGAAPWLVRAWYGARYRMPSSRYWLEHHIEGHHVYGTNRSGRDRFEVFPEEGQMMEDAFFDRMFDPDEKVAVDNAFVTVPLPTTSRELLRARTRIYQGNWQLADWLRVHRPDRLHAEGGMPKAPRTSSGWIQYLLSGGSTFPSWRPSDVFPVLVAISVNGIAKTKARWMVWAGRQSAWR